MSMDNMVPEIRFKGFGGEWVYKKLQELTHKGFSNGVFNDPQKVGKGYRLINVKDMYTGDSINIDNLSLVDIGEKEFNNNKVEYGDIFFTRSSLVREGIAYSNVNLSDRHDITFDGHLIRMQPCKTTTDPVFLAYLFKTSSARKQFILGGKTTTMTTIGQSDIAVVELAQPDKPEQTQIGNYFQKLDTLINQHQQKHDKLSSIKKAMLEKMFPKQGETIPEIRFKGFSGAWEEKELGELAEIVRGASPRPIEDPKWFDSQSSVGWLRIRDVTEQDGRIHYLEQRISKLGQEKTRVLYEKHLLLSIAASVGKPVVNYVETGVHDGFLIFKKPLFELEFMYQWLKSFEAKWQQFGQPGSQVNLNSDIVKSQVVTIPTNKEQTAIGNYFQKLDALINQHQQQITKLNNIKQACLSKMFI
ncbi:restriction endonuclease subunit S [Yersinia enterocolitica]|nr:restriction endonuclease subunit S [Yersinia enterocolitica]